MWQTIEVEPSASFARFASTLAEEEDDDDAFFFEHGLSDMICIVSSARLIVCILRINVERISD